MIISICSIEGVSAEYPSLDSKWSTLIKEPSDVGNYQLTLLLICKILCLDAFKWPSQKAWRPLVEGDEQPDWPNSQTSMKWCHPCAAYFLGVCQNTTAYHLGRYSLHLLLLKSSMAKVIVTWISSLKTQVSMIRLHVHLKVYSSQLSHAIRADLHRYNLTLADLAQVIVTR